MGSRKAITLLTLLIITVDSTLPNIRRVDPILSSLSPFPTHTPKLTQSLEQDPETPRKLQENNIGSWSTAIAPVNIGRRNIVSAVSESIPSYSNTYESIRIEIFTEEAERTLTQLNPELYTYLTQEVIPSALDYVKQTVRTATSFGPLKLQRGCQSYWVSNSRSSGESGQIKCKAVAEGFDQCGDTVISLSHFDAITICPVSPFTCTTLPAGLGIPNTDVVVYLSANSEASHCVGKTRGYSGVCHRDYLDRPISGHINICGKNFASGFLSSSSEYHYLRWREDVAFIVHELLHILGMSADSFAFMRNFDGSPRTPRDALGFPPVKADKSGYLASESVFQSTKDARGGTYMQLKLPTTVKFSRNHFQCPSINGVPLEDEGDVSSQGSHWERRVFYSEGLTAVLAFSPEFSPLSLSVLEDSDWYLPRYYRSMPLTFGSAALANSAIQENQESGCDFVSKKYSCAAGSVPSNYDSTYLCPAPPAPPPLTPNAPPYTPPQISTKQCTYDYSAKGSCAPSGTTAFLNECAVATPYDVYLSSNGNVFNQDTQKYTSHCNIKANQALAVKSMGEEYGKNSACFMAIASGTTMSTPNCYEYQCRLSSQNKSSENASFAAVDIFFLMATHSLMDSRKPSMRCLATEQGKKKRMPSPFLGEVICPNVAMLCKSFPCYNNGIWRHNSCLCPPGFIGLRCEVILTYLARQLYPITNYHRYHSDISLIAGEHYSLEVIERGKGKEFRAITCLPSGLKIDTQTGLLQGSPKESSSCLPYTINILSSAGKETRITIMIAILSSRIPSSPRSPCGNVIQGTQQMTLNANVDIHNHKCYSHSDPSYLSMVDMLGGDEKYILDTKGEVVAWNEEESFTSCLLFHNRNSTSCSLAYGIRLEDVVGLNWVYKFFVSSFSYSIFGSSSFFVFLLLFSLLIQLYI